MEEILKEITDLVVEGEDEEVPKVVQKALDASIDANVILREGLVTAMDVVGPRMASGDMYVPEVLMCADAMRAGLEILNPILAEGDNASLGKIIIGSVEGDLHDIGKNLVAMMLESSGFEVIDIGINQSTPRFEMAIEEHDPDIVALSALLTTTMPALKETTKALKEKGYRSKILVGGAPVDQAYADEIGADGYAEDGAGAVVCSKQLLNIA
ncbi:corrinoid protein [Eubacterium callanderi]|uniref:corrinoid protein n=1 Tax=Eubacterium callanderi TaxID=53442 RepID=UPI002672CBDF|nr:corrinoid protein [Eubacterium callanderi]